MTEIVLDVPDDLPLPGLIDRLNNIIAEEHLKWMLLVGGLFYFKRMKQYFPEGV